MAKTDFNAPMSKGPVKPAVAEPNAFRNAAPGVTSDAGRFQASSNAPGQLVARVAHELNNPLDGILRYLNLAIRRLDNADEPKVVDYLLESRKGLLRMAQILRELLAYTRGGRPADEPVAIDHVVEEALRTLQDQAAERGVAITASYRDRRLPTVVGPTLLQVCCNLIKNALEAMPEGGMLTVTTGLIGDEVVIRFEDTGVGLPPAIDRIFEPFFTTKGASGGTGLGLAISKDYIERLGGVLIAGRRDGGGAVFTIRLPIRESAAGIPPTTPGDL